MSGDLGQQETGASLKSQPLRSTQIETAHNELGRGGQDERKGEEEKGRLPKKARRLDDPAVLEALKQTLGALAGRHPSTVGGELMMMRGHLPSISWPGDGLHWEPHS